MEKKQAKELEEQHKAKWIAQRCRRKEEKDDSYETLYGQVDSFRKVLEISVPRADNKDSWEVFDVYLQWWRNRVTNLYETDEKWLAKMKEVRYYKEQLKLVTRERDRLKATIYN